MTKKREIKGFWWSPSNPETRWFGVLTFEKGDGPTLEICTERRSLLEDIRPLGRVIHGQDEHCKPVTLLFVGSSGDAISGALVTRTFDAGYALLGIALPDAANFVAHTLRFQTQHLYGWLGITGFDKSQPNTFKDHVIRHHRPEDQCFTISPDLELALHSTVETGADFQERKIKENAAVSFRSKSDLSLNRCFELVNAIRLLVHLASLKRIFPVWMTASQNGHGNQVGDRSIDQDIEIWSSVLREPKSEIPISDSWVFQFSDVAGNFTEFMRRWLDYTERFEEALKCYSCTVYHRLPDALHHLNLTQALEAYHGVRFASHHKQEFKAKIEELADLHAGSLSGLVDSPADFAERVLRTRNYYTHHNPKWLETGKVAKKAELWRVNEKLKLLFQICVLTDNGIPADRFSRLRRQIATEVIDYV
jgi:hypothetical protein